MQKVKGKIIQDAMLRHWHYDYDNPAPSPNSMAYKSYVLMDLKQSMQILMNYKCDIEQFTMEMEKNAEREKELSEFIEMAKCEHDRYAKKVDVMYEYIFKDKGHLVVGEVKQPDGEYKKEALLYEHQEFYKD